MKNFIQSGDAIIHTVSGSAIASGAPVQIGNMVGIAAMDGAVGEDIPVNLKGVFKITKVGSQAWAKGDEIFWDHTNSVFTKTASSDADTKAGVAFEAVGSGAGETTGYVLLIPGMGKKAASEAAVATADGSDAATTQALANALKSSFNSLLTKLKAAGVMDN